MLVVPQEELEGYKKALADRGLSLPKVSALDKKLSQLQGLVSYTLTNSEITAMVERKNTLRRKQDPFYRARLLRDLDEARASGNTILAGQIQDDLDSLGKAAGLAFRTSLRPDKGASPSPATSQQDRLAQLNSDIRRRNIEDIRRAQVQDRQKMQAREKEHRLAMGEATPEGKPRGKGKPLDENTPGGSRVASGTSTPVNGAGAGAGAGAAKKDQVLPEIAKLKEQRYAQNTGIPTVHKPLMDDDVIGSLDIGIDVDID
jgi:RNA polymerase-associated protein RTF1